MINLNDILNKLKELHPSKTEEDLIQDAGFVIGYNIGRNLALDLDDPKALADILEARLKEEN